MMRNTNIAQERNPFEGSLTGIEQEKSHRPNCDGVFCFSGGGFLPSFSVVQRASHGFSVLLRNCTVFVSWYKDKHWDMTTFIGSGGMPSSHAATVLGLATSVGTKDNPGSSSFAVPIVLACVVMYDASGVRLHAGRQAEVLNQILIDLPPEHALAESSPLKKLLGHTPTQVVAGGILGCLVG